MSCSGLAFQRLCTFIEEHTQGTGFAGANLGPLTARALYALLVFLVILVIGRLLRRITMRALRRGGADVQVVVLVNNVFMGTTIAVAILGSVTAGGVNAAYLLTFGGLASLAVGLAFQDLLRNVLAGIFLLIERPFRIGDLITVGDLTGKVQTIQLRTTALRTGDGRLAVMPNLVAFNGTIINVHAFDVRQFTVSVRLPDGADLEAALRSARTELEATDNLATEPAPKVQPAVDIAEGVTIRCQYWLDERSTDPDAVSADLVRRLFAATRKERLAPPRRATPSSRE